VPTIELVVLSRSGCHLCEEMIAVAREVIARQPARLEVRDVDSDEALRARYGEEIPVLLVNGRLAFKYRVGARELRRRLRAEEARGWRRFLARLR
jgi:hypothetical protein